MEQVLKDLDSSKSPGSPLCYLSPTNAGVLETHTCEFIRSVESQLHDWRNIGKALVESDDFEAGIGFGMSREEYDRKCVGLLNSGVTRSVLLRRKSEPRKKGKRPRLVCMVSSDTNTAARVLLSDYLIAEQEAGNNITAAVGLDLTTPSKTQERYEEFVLNSPLSSNDVEGWEYSTGLTLHWASFNQYAMRMKLINSDLRIIEGKEETYYVLLGYYFCSAFRILQSDDGQLFTGPPANTSSGELITFSKNSSSRTLLNDYVNVQLGFPLGGYNKSAGDDNLDSRIPKENPEATITAMYASLGFTITDVAIQTNVFDFCSTVFADGKSYQENIRKAYATFFFEKALTQQLFAEKLAGFDAGFNRHPDYRAYRDSILMFASLK